MFTLMKLQFLILIIYFFVYILSEQDFRNDFYQDIFYFMQWMAMICCALFVIEFYLIMLYWIFNLFSF